MRYTLDTNVRGSALRSRPLSVKARFDELGPALWSAAEHCGDARAELQRSGAPIGATDTMIAPHARSQGATPVSNAARHLARAPGLLLANWA